MENKNYQAILSFGYLYIVILGLLKEAFYYSQLGVDYFNYSTIADILISPIAEITSNVKILSIVLFLVILTLVLPNYLAKNTDKSWVKKMFKIDTQKDGKDLVKHLSQMCFSMLCIGLLGFYFGVGIGSGHKTATKIEQGTLEFKDRIEFQNGQIDTVYIIGKNSSYLFYLPKGKKEIEITPINSGGVKSIVEK